MKARSGMSRLLAVVLCCMMLLTTVPAAAFADTMQGVTVSGDVLSWSPVEGAAGYRVSVGDSAGDTTGATSVNLKTLCEAGGLAAGAYNVSLYALDAEGNSITDSHTTSYSYESSDEGTRGPATDSYSYVVSFDANGGSGEITPIHSDTAQFALPLCIFTPPAGKQFKGWATTPTGGIITGGSVNLTEDTTLFAIWGDISSSISAGLQFIDGMPMEAGDGLDVWIDVTNTGENPVSLYSYSCTYPDGSDALSTVTDSYGTTGRIDPGKDKESWFHFTVTDKDIADGKIARRITVGAAVLQESGETMERVWSNTVHIEREIAAEDYSDASVGMDKNSDYRLSEFPFGYSDDDTYPFPVSVSNVGTTGSGRVNITLEGSSAFTVTPATFENIPARKSVSFEVRPKTGMPVGTHTVTVKLSGDYIFESSFTLTFRVYSTDPTITFDANGGSGSMPDVSTDQSTYTLPGCRFTPPDGKVFKGWSTDPDGSVITGGTIEVTGDITLYAIWKNDLPTLDASISPDGILSWEPVDGAPKYSIMILDDDGDNIVVHETGTQRDLKQLLSSRGKPMGVTYPISLMAIDDGTTTLLSKRWAGEYRYAIYTLSFDANGGTGDMEDETNLFGNHTLPECGFTAPEGKTFQGWAFSADGDVLPETIVIAADTTLFAIWEDEAEQKINATVSPEGVLSWEALPGAASYAVTLSDGDRNVTVYTGQTQYNLRDLAQDEGFPSGEYDVHLEAEDENQVILPRKWDGTYDFTSNNPRLDAPANLRFYNGAASWDQVPEAEGYLIRLLDGEGRIAKTISTMLSSWDMLEYMVDGETYTYTVYARAEGYQDSETVTGPAYTCSAATVSFDANGGTGTMAEVTDVIGSYTLPECTFDAPQGKRFAGWALSADGTVIGELGIMVASDTTLYAIWEDDDTQTDGHLTIEKTFTGITAKEIPENLHFIISNADGIFEDVGIASFTDVEVADNYIYKSYDMKVPAGQYTVTEVNALVEGYDLSATLNKFPASDNLPITVEAGGNASAIFQNEYKPQINIKKGSLKIAKTFTGIELDEIPTELNIIVTDAGGNARLLPISEFSTVEDYPMTKVLTVELPQGEYTLSESGGSIPGYTMTPTIPGSVTVDSGSTTTVQIYNNYTTTTGTLVLQKTFTGITEDKIPGNLTFEIKGDSFSETVKIDTFAVGKATGQGEIVRTLELEVPQGDYTVTESGAEVTGYTLNTSYGNAASGSGGAEISVDNGSIATVEIANAYTPQEVEVGTLLIVKSFEGITEDEIPAGLTFTVTGEGGISTTVKITDFIDYMGPVSQGTFSKMTALSVPVGTWVVTESNADIPGYTLETAYGTGSTGSGVQTTVSKALGGAANFKNTYTKQTGGADTETVTIGFTKTVRLGGTNPAPAQSFELEIFNIGNSAADSYRDVKYTSGVATNGAGTYSGSLTLTGPADQLRSFTCEGFLVREKNTGAAGWQYDTAIYGVRFTENGGKLEANIYPTSTSGNTISVDGLNPTGSMAFTNTYTKTPTTPTTPGGPAQTGDSSNMALWVLMLIASLIGITATALFGRQKKRRS